MAGAPVSPSNGNATAKNISGANRFQVIVFITLAGNNNYSVAVTNPAFGFAISQHGAQRGCSDAHTQPIELSQ